MSGPNVISPRVDSNTDGSNTRRGSMEEEKSQTSGGLKGGPSNGQTSGTGSGMAIESSSSESEAGPWKLETEERPAPTSNIPDRKKELRFWKPIEAAIKVRPEDSGYWYPAYFDVPNNEASSKKARQPSELGIERCFLLPEIWYRQAKDASLRGSGSKKANQDNGCITGALDINGKEPSMVYERKEQIMLYVKNTQNVYRRLKEAQSVEVQAKFQQDLDKGNYSWTKILWNNSDPMHGRCALVRKEAEVEKGKDVAPIDGQYVQIRRADIQKINVTGGVTLSSEVYIWRPLIEYWAGIKTKQQVEARGESESAVLSALTCLFIVRDGKGRRYALKAEKLANARVTNDEDEKKLLDDSKESQMAVEQKWKYAKWFVVGWQGRYNRGTGLEQGKLDRALNPEIKLYLVPMKPEDKVLLRIYATAAKSKAKTSKQTYEVLDGKDVDTRSEENKDSKKYVKVATCPFNFYETWLSITTWSDYWQARPDRDLPDATKLLAVKQLKRADELTEAVKVRADLEKFRKSNNILPGANNIITTSEVTPAKILTARGKRDDTPMKDQSRVMGYTANEVARSLKWRDTEQRIQQVGKAPGVIWPAPGVWAAEWLHRSAFSWGGLAGDGQMVSSQLRENLIFGTSECNSVMIRYETAWQALVLKAGAANKSAKRQPDTGSTESWSRKGFAVGTLSTNIHPLIYSERAATGQKTKSVPKLRDTNGKPALEYITYGMTYRLRIPSEKRILGAPFCHEVYFYPFQRGFFTVLEAEIDDQILDARYGLVEDLEVADLKEEQKMAIEPATKTLALHRRQAVPSAIHESDASSNTAHVPTDPLHEGTKIDQGTRTVMTGILQVIDASIMTMQRTLRVADSAVSTSNLQNGSDQASSGTAVTKTLKLFGIRDVEMIEIPATDALPELQQITLSEEVRITELIPALSIDTDQFASLRLRELILSYQVKETALHAAGLYLSAKIPLNGVGQEYAAFLRELFGQSEPVVAVTGFIDVDSDWTRTPPSPAYLSLTTGLSKVNVNVLNVLNVTGFDVEIFGNRTSSAGNYSFGLSFFGHGKILDADVVWTVSKFDSDYQIFVRMHEDSWRNFCGIQNFDLDDVSMQATWSAGDMKKGSLSIQATFSFPSGIIALQGEISSEHTTIYGTLLNCNINQLVQLCKYLFALDVKATDSSRIQMSSLVFAYISKSSKKAISLHGEIIIDGHTCAEATIFLSVDGISIHGAVSDFDIPGLVTIHDASLDVSLSKQTSSIAIKGKVSFGKAVFQAAIELDKSGGTTLYTLLARYDGAFSLAQLDERLLGTFMDDIKVESVGICVSNRKQNGTILGNPLNLPVKEGSFLYAQITVPQPLGDILWLDGTKMVPLVVALPRKADVNSTGSSTGTVLTTAHIDLAPDMKFKCGPIESDQLLLDINFAEDPSLDLNAVIHLQVPDNVSLNLKLSLSLGSHEAKGSAMMLQGERWMNPFGICKEVTVSEVGLQLGIRYGKFTKDGGSGADLAIVGKLIVEDFTGKALVCIGTNPTSRLIYFDIKNLDVAALVRFVGKIAGFNIPVPSGGDIFFIHTLQFYIAAGDIQALGTQFRRGLSFNADITILGKKAKISATLTSQLIKIEGTVEAFQVGPVQVTGSCGKDPYLSIELSSSTQKIIVDGQIKLGSSYISLEVRIDTQNSEFYLHWQLVILDALSISFIAQLKDGQQQPRLIVGPGDNGQERKLVSGDSSAAGKEFEVKAELAADILGYCLDTINNYLSDYGDPGRKARLQVAERRALEDQQKMESVVNDIRKKLEGEVTQWQKDHDAQQAIIEAEIRGLEDALHKLKDEEVRSSNSMAADRDAALKIAAEAENVHYLRAERDARLSNQILEVFKREVIVAEQDNLMVLKANAEKLAVQIQALSQQIVMKIQLIDAHPPSATQTTSLKTLNTQLDMLQKEYVSANAEWSAMSSQDTYYHKKELAQQLARFTQANKDAQERLEALPQSREARLVAIQEQWGVEQKRTERKRAVTRKNLQVDLDVANKALNDFKAQRALDWGPFSSEHNVENTEQWTQLQALKETYQKARVANESHGEFQNILLGVVKVMTEPIRKLMGLLHNAINIKKVTLFGSLNTVNDRAKIGAKVWITVSGTDYEWDIEFDLTNLVHFLKELWRKICEICKFFIEAFKNLGQWLDEHVDQHTLEQIAKDNTIGNPHDGHW